MSEENHPPQEQPRRRITITPSSRPPTGPTPPEGSAPPQPTSVIQLTFRIFGQDRIVEILNNYPQLTDAIGTAWWGYWWTIDSAHRLPLGPRTRANMMHDYFWQSINEKADETPGLRTITHNQSNYILVNDELLLQFRRSSIEGKLSLNGTKRTCQFTEQQPIDGLPTDVPPDAEHFYLAYVPGEDRDAPLDILLIRPSDINTALWIEPFDTLERAAYEGKGPVLADAGRPAPNGPAPRPIVSIRLRPELTDDETLDGDAADE